MKTILAKKNTLMFVSGTMGSGKTVTVVKYLVDYFFPENTGRVITNVALNPDAIADRVHRKHKHISKAEVKRRIIFIPPDDNQAMINGEYSLAEWIERFIDKETEELGVPRNEKEWMVSKDEPNLYEHPLRRGLVLIDEAQKWWPSGHGDGKGQNQSGMEFVSTIRHRGARMILISQDFDNIASKIRKLVAGRIFIRNCAQWNFPVIGLPMDVILQCWAFFGMGYVPWVTIEEYSGNPERGESLEVSAKHWLPSEIFNCYRSRDVGDLEGEEEQLEYIRFSKVRFLKWVFVTHSFAWLRIVGITAAFLILIWPYGLLITVARTTWRNVTARLQNTLTGSNLAEQTAEKFESDESRIIEEKDVPEDEQSELPDTSPQDWIKIIDAESVVFASGLRLQKNQHHERYGKLNDIDFFEGRADFDNAVLRLRSAWLSDAPRSAYDPTNRISESVPTDAREVSQRSREGKQ